MGAREIGGETVPYVEFGLTESPLGDDTNTFTILDQGGIPNSTIPTMNEWGMVIFSLLMAGAAFVAIRRCQQ